MLKTDNPKEKILTMDNIGTFQTPSGLFQVLVVTIKRKRKTMSAKLENIAINCCLDSYVRKGLIDPIIAYFLRKWYGAVT